MATSVILVHQCTTCGKKATDEEKKKFAEARAKGGVSTIEFHSAPCETCSQKQNEQLKNGAQISMDFRNGQMVRKIVMPGEPGYTKSGLNMTFGNMNVSGHSVTFG
jgi:hypothetical protein